MVSPEDVCATLLVSFRTIPQLAMRLQIPAQSVWSDVHHTPAAVPRPAPENRSGAALHYCGCRSYSPTRVIRAAGLPDRVAPPPQLAARPVVLVVRSGDGFG